MSLPRGQLWMGPTTYLGKGSRQKKSPVGLDYVPALFRTEEEGALVTLFETLQPTWYTSVNKHLKHYSYTMGANGNHLQRRTDVPGEFKPYI